MEDELSGGRLTSIEIKRKEERVDLVGVFNDHVTEVYKNYTQIYTDGTKNPETGIT